MNKALLVGTLAISLLFGFGTRVSSTSVVTLVGAHIKAKDAPIVSKYKRAECSVCKGKGWYISGDGIEKVDCGYCEE